MTIAQIGDRVTIHYIGTLDNEFTEIFLEGNAGWVAGETEFSQAPELTYNLGFQHTCEGHPGNSSGSGIGDRTAPLSRSQ